MSFLKYCITIFIYLLQLLNILNMNSNEEQSHEQDPPQLDKDLNDNIDHEREQADNHNEERNGYEDLDQMLDEETRAKEETILRFKVHELQKICNSLTNTNRKLIDKLTEFQEQRQQREGNQKQEIFVDEYSQLNGDFTQVQSLIHEYKQSLDQFQRNVLADMRIKQQKISKMKNQILRLQEQNTLLDTEREDLMKINKQLETRNQGLIVQIENLEKDKLRLEETISINRQSEYYWPYRPRYQINYNQNEEELPIQIQNQYQMLIDKLIKELEHERNVKKKMNEEIRRMSQQLMVSERQIMEKNKKLYQIQMKLLKNTKTNADSSINYPKYRVEDLRIRGLRQNNSISKNNHKSVDRIEPKPPSFKSFILLELINGELDQEISSHQKKVIGIKVIQFYQRKLERQDYSNVMPQNLLVYNFSHRKPELLTIRKVGTSAYQDGQKTQESLVWNLTFILDNLFSQGQGIQDFNEILELTGQMLQKRETNTRQDLLILKDLLSL